MSVQRIVPYPRESQTLDIAPENQPSEKIAIPASPEGVPRQTALLLDDREDFREVIEEYLISRLYRVTAVSDGVEGVREIVKGPFDLIICDMMMPRLNGEMFYWAVTRLRPAASQRFIFFTGHQNNPVIQAFFQRINATVLIKPFKLDALNSAILDVNRRLR